MSNDMRIVKFKMMIRDIWDNLGQSVLVREITDSNGGYINGGWGTAWLAIIFDYNKLNDYGKVIMDQVCMLDQDEFSDQGDAVKSIRIFVERCKDMEYRMKAAKGLVGMLNKQCREFDFELRGRYEGLLFIFWSLMILAVDETDKEDYLSLICDFAEMLKIRDVEMMDLVQIIRAICHMEGNKNIKTKSVEALFRNVIERYEDLSVEYEREFCVFQA